jgi:hypothetical protein
MRIRFVHQILIGTRVHGVGEVVELDDRAAADLVRQGVAFEDVPPPAPADVVPIRLVREQTSEPTQARKAVRR